jgi:hypothetical protein
MFQEVIYLILRFLLSFHLQYTGRLCYQLLCRDVRVPQCMAWFLAGGEVSGAGGRAYWAWLIVGGMGVYLFGTSVTRSAVLTAAERRAKPNMTLQ